MLTERRTEEAKEIRRKFRQVGRDFSPRRGKELVPQTDDISNCLTASQSLEHLILEPNEVLVLGRAEGINGHDLLKRVYSTEGVSPTLDTCVGGNRQPKVYTTYRIRKLTPKEFIRLMGFSDEDYQALKDAGMSNSQIYKVCGNSIVVNVVEAILQALFIKDNLWNKL